MKPFKTNPRKKNLQLKKSSFNLKDFVSKIFESPDKMHPKLQSMLNKNSDTLHAFIELGGLSKIYEYLQYYYQRNDELQIIKWLKILNHQHFPVDTELIKQIGLTQFINKQIKSKYNNHNNHNQSPLISLTQSIEQKWIKELKEQKKKFNQRDPNRKRVSYPSQVENRVVFKKYDKPSTIKSKQNKHRSSSNSNSNSNHIPKPILMRKSMKNGHNLQSNHNHDINQQNGRDLMEFEIEDNEYTLEYVEEDNDIDMDGNSNNKYESTDDDDDDIDLNHFKDMDSPKLNARNNNNNNSNSNNSIDHKEDIVMMGQESQLQGMIEEIIWYRPIMIRYDENDYIKYTVIDTDATKKEEHRIKDKDMVQSMECIELPDMNGNHGMNGHKECSVEVPSDYPHVCI